MNSIAIRIDKDAAEQVLTLFGENLGDLTKAFEKVGEVVLEDARGQIVSQGGVFGGGWAAMSPLTHVVAALLYGRGRDPRTLLMDTRGLLDSLQPHGPANIFETGPASASFGTEYVSSRTGFAVAKYQQQGTHRTFHVLQNEGFSEVGIPARVFLSFRDDPAEYEAIFLAHLLSGFEGEPQ